MAATFTTSLRLTKQGTGDNPNSWGSVLNMQVFELVDAAIAGIETINATGSGDITLTTNNGASDQARKAILAFTGTPAVDRNVVVPALSKTYVVFNNTSANNLVFKASGSSEEIPVSYGEKAFIFCDGTDLYELINTGSLIPSGLIAQWSGTIANIPSGWVFCDGNNGTPDLRDKCIIGARQDDAGVAKTNITGSLTTSGGSASLVTNPSGVHSHGGNTQAHVLTISEIPPHTHSYARYVSLSNVQINVANSPAWINTGNVNSGSTGGGAGHSHVINEDGAHIHTLTNQLPPYYALAFIMKT